jgi:hypothetical protein
LGSDNGLAFARERPHATGPSMILRFSCGGAVRFNGFTTAPPAYRSAGNRTERLNRPTTAPAKSETLAITNSQTSRLHPASTSRSNSPPTQAEQNVANANIATVHPETSACFPHSLQVT